MIINNEKELIDLIKNKSFNEVKEIFKNYKVNLKKLNDFQDTLFYLIKHNYSFDIIKFFIDKRQQPQIDNTDILFHSIEHGLFKIAKLILNYGTPMDSKNKDSKNIIEFLGEKIYHEYSEIIEVINKIIKKENEK